MTSDSQAPKPVLGRGVLLLLRIWLGVLTVITVVLVVLAIRELVDPASDGQPGTVVITNCNYDRTYRHCYAGFRRGPGFGRDYLAWLRRCDQPDDCRGLRVFLLIWVGMSYFLVYRPLRRRRRNANSAPNR